MNKLFRTGVAATALSVLVAPLAFASGWIVVDPLTPRPINIVRPPVIHPGRPGPVIPNPLPGPVLKGSVSFGLHLKSEDVRVDINGPVARTYITQEFANDTDQNLAGTYLFPLPEDTTFSSFTLEIDGKPVEGKILEAQEARQEYESIVRRMVDPGLLEYADYKTVRARVFPIPAHGTKKIQLEYTQTIKAESGLYKYRFPLKVEENAAPAEHVNIDVKLASEHGLRTIWSPSHTIQSNRDGEHKANIKYAAQDVLPDKDFSLYYSVSDKAMSADMLAQRSPGSDGYFLISVAPPVTAKAIEKKDIVLVADTSGSMSGDKMDECKKALKYIVNSLNPGDRFGIVQFNTDAESFRHSLVDATPENRKAAVSFIDDLEARGGTNIGEAMNLGSEMLNKGDVARPAYIVLMTDGEPTVGDTNIASLSKVAGAKRDVRVFDFGVGYDVNTKLLNAMADGHHGAAQYVEPSENLETALSGFYRKIKSPVLSDVKITYDGVEVKDVYPREVKDIFAGSQVLLIGKYKTSGAAKLKISGKLDGKQQEYVFPVTFPAEQSGHTYLNRLWAMRRIGHLTEVAQANGDTREVIDEIVALSKKYGIISQYTSFLATDPAENARLAHGMPVAFGGGGRRGLPQRLMAANSEAAAAPMGAPMAPPVPSGNKAIAMSAPGRTRALQSASFFNSPREVQFIDSRPIVRDFRAGSGGAAPAGAPRQDELKKSRRLLFRNRTRRGRKSKTKQQSAQFNCLGQRCCDRRH